MVSGSVVIWRNIAEYCRRGLFQDSGFAGDLEDSLSRQQKEFCVFSEVGTFVISLDSLDLWDLVIEVLHSPSPSSLCPGRPGALRSQCGERPKIRTMLKPLTSEESYLREMDYVAPSAKLSHQNALLYIFEDNEAVIKMIIENRSSTMRHVSRTHRVALDWLFDRINLDPKIRAKYVDTRSQLADILTTGTFTRDEWNQLFPLFNTMGASFLSQPF